MELNGLSERARKLIESCGYGKPHFMSEDDVAERQAFFEEEGYTVSDEAKEIIDNFYMLSIGKHGTFKDGTFVITENDDIENKLVVYPENIYDALTCSSSFPTQWATTLSLWDLSTTTLSLSEAAVKYISSAMTFMLAEIHG